MNGKVILIKQLHLVSVITLAITTVGSLTACGGSDNNKGGGDTKPVVKQEDSFNNAKDKMPKSALEGETVSLPRLSDQGLPIIYDTLYKSSPNCTVGADGYSITMRAASLNPNGDVALCTFKGGNDGGNAQIAYQSWLFTIEIYPLCPSDQVNGEQSHRCIPKDVKINTSTSQITTLGTPLQASLTGYNLSKDFVIQTTACTDIKNIEVLTNYNDIDTLSFSCTPQTAGTYDLTIKDKQGTSVIYNGKIEVQLPQVLGGSKKLNKTGVDYCATATEMKVSCSLATLGSDWFGLKQDGEVQAGMPLTYSKKQYQNNKTNQTDTCIQDGSTGLIWEVKLDDDGLHDKDWQYTWYNSNSAINGGESGDEGVGKDFCGDTLTNCNSQAYINALNANGYCGYSDWRLPEVYELVNLVDYGRAQPSINPIFSNTVYEETGFKKFYLTNTTSGKLNALEYSSVDFAWGSHVSSQKNYDLAYIRAVRADTP